MSNIADNSPQIQSDAKEVVQSEEANRNNVKLEIVNGNYSQLRGHIMGPPGTPYEGGVFVLEIVIPDNYPSYPPEVKFETKTWHPNIHSETGQIRLDILKNEWVPEMTLRAVLLSIQALLASPEPDNPQDAVAAQQYKEQHAAFITTAKDWTKTYADGQMPPDEECS